jgi:HK97 family phage major capsid protein/HK97 family phage prohead protease
MKQVQKSGVQTESPFTFALSVDGVVDRHGDIVDVNKSSVDLTDFKANPIALAFHDHNQPIGVWENVRFEGGKLLADLKMAAKGTSDYIDTLRSLVEQKILKAVSIGFRAQEYEPIKGGGYRFTKWALHEASLVSVPAHPQALAVAKSLGLKDAEINKFFTAETSFGTSKVEKTSPADVGKTVSIKSTQENNQMKTFAEQIKGFEARKTELQTTANGILQKSADEGRTLDATESESYDQAVAEIAAVEKHIERLQTAEKSSIATAKPVDGTSVQKAADNRAGIITVKENLPEGIAFARFAKCIALSKGNLMQAEHIAKNQYPEDNRIQNVIKAAVAAGTTTGTTWAAPLVDYTNLTSDFIEFLRPKTVIGRFGQGGIPALRQIPFNVKISGQTSGGASYWTGEGAGKGLMKTDFNNIEFGYSKVAAISVLTEELLRFSNPAAEMLVRDTMVAALVERLDADFINPAKAAVAGVSPASITNGLTAVAASGTTIEAAKTDIKALFGKFITAKLSLTSGVWIMHPSMALSLGMASNALGQPEFPGLNMNGGVLMGMPVIVTEHTASGTIVLVAANEIYIAQDGVMVDASREASLEMSDAPTVNSGTSTGASLVSMFQTNSVALRCEQYVNWKRRRNDAVAIITGAAYTG